MLRDLKTTRFFVIFCGPFLNARFGWLCKCHSRIGVCTWCTLLTLKNRQRKNVKKSSSVSAAEWLLGSNVDGRSPSPAAQWLRTRASPVYLQSPSPPTDTFGELVASFRLGILFFLAVKLLHIIFDLQHLQQQHIVKTRYLAVTC